MKLWRMRKLTYLTIILGVLLYLGIRVLSDHDKYTEEANKDNGRTAEEEAIRSQESEEDCGDGKSCDKAAESVKQDKTGETLQVKTETIHLAVVACGDRIPETVIMLKSALMLTRAPLHFHIFTEDELRPNLTQLINEWPQKIRDQFNINVYPISFPGVDNPKAWIKLFKPCACQRLFIPYILEDVEKILYVDTDILFLSSLEDIWSFYDEFNSTHISALSPEHEEPWMGWYNRFARHPYYGPLGVNSGVMLMDLDRMRAADWRPYMITYFNKYRYNTTWGDQDLINIFFHFHPGVNSGVMLMHLARMRSNSWIANIKEYYAKYEKRTTWGDQDLINIYFHFFPEQLYVYSCKWNYRPDHCMYGSNCKAADKEGIKILHGSRRVFHNEKQLAFRAVYDIVKEYEFGEDLETQILKRITYDVTAKAGDAYCGKVVNQFTKELAMQITNLNTR